MAEYFAVFWIFQGDCLCLVPGSSTGWREAQGTLGTFLSPGVAGGERFVPLKVGELTFLTIPKNLIFPLELFLTLTNLVCNAVKGRGCECLY